MQSKKQFLFVTYYFPPAGGPAVQRIIRIIQYMAEMGWQCIVLTVKNGEYTSLDSQLAKEIPAGTEVIHTDIFEPYKIYCKFIGKKEGDKIPLAVLSSHSKASWKEKIANTVRANLFIPDARIGWYNYGVKAGIQAVQKNCAIRLILSSGPPHTVHLVAKRIAKKTGLPHVADFRDPWINIDYYSGIKRFPLSLAIDRYLEKKVLSSADAITSVSPGCQDLLTDHHHNLDPGRFHIVYNGFDPSVYPQPVPEPPGDKFIITYIGNIPYSRYTPFFFKAISQLKNENKISPDHFQVHFYGNIDSSVRLELKASGIDDFLHTHEFIPHQQAIIRICKSHLLLLIINNTHTKKAIVTGKLFEYLGSRRPILCIGPVDGDAALILNKTQGGLCFDYNDISGMKEYLLEQFQNWQEGKTLKSLPSQIETFSRHQQLKKMVVVFKSFLSEGSSFFRH